MPETSNLKNELRSHFLSVRNALPQEVVENKSRKIVDKVLGSPEFKQSNTIHTYISIKENHEVDTYPFIEQAFKKVKKIVVPKIIGEGQLDHVELNSLNELEKNNWGVPEPSNSQSISIDNLDLVIVPMVAGDRQKNRLGYGKGYYDRFLKNCRAVKMGLLFDCQIYENELPVESFDIPLDILVTESQRIE